MFANERYKIIISLLREKGSVTVSELMDTFGVSLETVRRDLSYLESQNQLKRVHGGAVPFSMKGFKKLKQRLGDNQDKKRRLSQTACALIDEEDIIAIDAGSTAVVFASVLKEQFRRLTVVTNSLDVFEKLQDMEEYRLILTGGKYMPEEAAFYGKITLDTIGGMHFPKCFLFPAAISLENGVSAYPSELVSIEEAFLRHSKKAIVLADSTKFEKSAFMRICPVSPFHLYITDNEIKDSIKQLYKENGIHIYTQQEELLCQKK